MKTLNIHDEIVETLEMCVSKMSKKLKNNFDPEDKNSLKLLQHYRSTLTTLAKWIKQAVNIIEKPIADSPKVANEKAKNTFTKSKNKNTKKNQPLTPYDEFMNKERNQLTNLKQPYSGLLCSPISGCIHLAE